jgi:hypothetical protein
MKLPDFSKRNAWHWNGGRASWLAAALAALITGMLYWRTVHPGVGPYLDSVEYQITVQVLGVSHPPGYPLYTLLGKLFVSLVPISNPAFRLNLMSAVCSVGTVVLVQRLTYRLTRNVPISLLGALTLGSAVRFWYQATYTELYPLYTLLVAATFLSLVMWMQTRRMAFYFASAALYALCFGVNAPAIVLLPAWLWAVLTTDHRTLTRPRGFALTTMIVLLAAAQYLYVPLRALAARPAFCNYCPTTWSEVPTFLSGQEWWGISFGVPGKYWLQRWADTGYQLALQFWPIGIMLGAVGLWNLLRREARLAITFILGLTGVWFFVVTYDVVDWSDFMTPIYVLYAPLIALGLKDGWSWLREQLVRWDAVWRRLVRQTVLVLAVVTTVGLLFATYHNNYPLVDQSQNTTWHAWARDLLHQMEPGAWLLTPPTPTDGFAQSWALRFVSWSEQLVPDMQVVYLPGYDPPGPAPGYLRWEDAAPQLSDHPVYVIELNDDRLRDYALLPILRSDGWTIGYRIVGQRTAEGVRPWISAERWAEIEGQLLMP